ncbi:MAG: MFS transporter [Acaryochloris sp. CRU_2_0]|nr:MFS transporter [Acaryochloris sp. CRU_2_0]
MQTFLLIWLGQVVSLLGTKLTEFALGVWVYQQNQSIAQLALVILLTYLPNTLISAIAGALVDRWDRRWAMILSDSAAGIGTLIIGFLVLSHQLAIWHIYLAVGVNSIFNAFQQPAYSAAIAQLTPPEQYSRINGMVQISRGIARVLSPAMAGFLIGIIGIGGILIIDFSTFLVALFTLLMVRFPTVHRRLTKPLQLQRLLQEMRFAGRYITQRPGLSRLLLYMSTNYFSIGILEVVFWPLILDFGSREELGLVLSIGGTGMLLGSIVITAWGGPKQRVYGLLYFIPLQGLIMLMAALKTSIPLAAMGLFVYLFAQPIIVSCNQAIWQSKVPHHFQGRVFALQQMIEKSLAIFAYIVVGPLVEDFLEPLMTSGPMAERLGSFIGGIGPGRGIALMVLLMGIGNLLATLIAYQSQRLRRLEIELPNLNPPKLSLTKTCP